GNVGCREARASVLGERPPGGEVLARRELAQAVFHGPVVPDAKVHGAVAPIGDQFGLDGPAYRGTRSRKGRWLISPGDRLFGGIVLVPLGIECGVPAREAADRQRIEGGRRVEQGGLLL